MACYLCIHHLGKKIQNVYRDNKVTEEFCKPKGSSGMRKNFFFVKTPGSYDSCVVNYRKSKGGIPVLKVWYEFDWKTHCSLTAEQIADIENPEKEVYPITGKEYSLSLIEQKSELA